MKQRSLLPVLVFAFCAGCTASSGPPGTVNYEDALRSCTIEDRGLRFLANGTYVRANGIPMNGQVHIFHDSLGHIWRRGFLKNGRLEGVLEVFDEWWDFKTEDITFRRGLRHGPNIVYSYHDIEDESTRYREIERWFHNGVQQGLEQAYWETGELKYAVPYRNGKREGIQQVYYKNGALEIERTFSNDKQNGLERHYCMPKGGAQTGTVLLETYFSDDVQHGTRRYYDDDGSIAVVTEYVNGEAHGWQTAYYADGQIKSKEQYSGGVLSGDYVLYGYDGAITEEGAYNGEQKAVKRYAYGQLEETAEYKRRGGSFVRDGQTVRYWREEPAAQAVHITASYTEGKKDGPETVYAPDGTVEREVLWDAGLPLGTYRLVKYEKDVWQRSVTFHNTGSGHIEETLAPYSKGLISDPGFFKSCYDYGRLVRTVTYKNGTMDGTAVFYDHHDDPALLTYTVLQWREDSTDGAETEYYADGTVKTAVDANRTTKRFSPQGHPVSEVTYDEDKYTIRGLVTLWTGDGRRFEAGFPDGLGAYYEWEDCSIPDTTVRAYYQDNSPWCELTYEKGEMVRGVLFPPGQHTRPMTQAEMTGIDEQYQSLLIPLVPVYYGDH